MEEEISKTTDSSSLNSSLQRELDEIWCAATEKAKAGDAAAAVPFVIAEKLQRDLTEKAEAKRLKELIADCKPFQQTILRELSANPQSGAWLLALPSNPSYRLRDDDYRMAVRKRLGMLPDNSLTEAACLACHGRNKNLPQLKQDPHHAEACLQQTGTSVTERHDAVARVVGQLARSVGATVQMAEPILGPALVESTDPETGETYEETQHSRSGSMCRCSREDESRIAISASTISGV
jgi:hypothetical protein